MTRADLILHPVRLRIIMAFASDLGTRQLTARQVAAAMPDVPQASLYRHIDQLYRGGILAIAGERRTRGGVERTYVLAAGGSTLTSDDLAKATREELLGYFTTFAVSLIAQFEQYLQGPDVDLFADAVGFRAIVMNLTDEEVQEMAGALNAVVGRFLRRRARPDRRRRIIATVVMPQDEG